MPKNEEEKGGGKSHMRTGSFSSISLIDEAEA